MTSKQSGQDRLEIQGHTIEATIVHEGAVLEWACAACGQEESDVEEFLAAECSPV